MILRETATRFVQQQINLYADGLKPISKAAKSVVNLFEQYSGHVLAADTKLIARLLKSKKKDAIIDYALTTITSELKKDEKKAPAPPAKPVLYCKVCYTSFYAVCTTKKYCSNRCLKRNYRQNKKQKLAKTNNTI